MKEKIKDMTLQKNEDLVKPDYEQIAKFEQESFVQEKFSSSINPQPTQQPKQKKKKKKQKLLQQQQQQQQPQQVADTKTDTISHDSAIFGTATETMHIGKFSSRINTKRKEELKNIEQEDLIFGPMFFEDPEIRMKRWIEKLTFMRKKIREEET